MRTPLLLGLLSAALLVSSCSDSTTTPEPVGAYIRPSGSYVTHSNVDVAIDAATKQTTNADAPDDSTVVVERSSTNGIERSVAHVYVDGAVTDTVIMMQNGSIVMQDFPIRYEIQSVVLDLGRKMVTIADFNASTWTALKDTIAPFDFPVLPGAKLSGALNFTGKPLGNEQVTIGTTKLSTRKVQLNLDATLYASIGATVISVPIGLVRTIWFADGVGVVKTEQAAAVVNLGAAGALLGSSTQAIPGFTQTAKSWSPTN